MRIAGNWELHHLSDRVVELRNYDPMYANVTGRPGYVRVRGEPGIDRTKLVDDALTEAKRCDEQVSELAARRFLPKGHIRDLQVAQARYKPAFATPEDPEVIGAKRA